MDTTVEIPFDQHQRYSFIKRVIETVDHEGTKTILEIGGAFSPLRKMIPQHRLIVSDYRADNGNVQIRADAFQLPFEDHSFDLAISTDVLEHVPPEKRNLMVKEMIRVTANILLIGFPAGVLSERIDSALSTYIRETLNIEYPFLQDHVHLGLPDELEIYKLMKSQNTEVYQFDNANLFSWLPMMKSNFSLEQYSEFDSVRSTMNRIFNEYYDCSSHARPVYRKFLLSFKRPTSIELRQQLEGLQTSQPPSESIAYAEATLQLTTCFTKILNEFKSRTTKLTMSLQFQLEEALRDLSDMRDELSKARQELNETNHKLVAKQEEVNLLKEQLDKQSFRIKNLQDYLNLFLSHPAYKAYKFFKNLIK